MLQPVPMNPLEIDFEMARRFIHVLHKDKRFWMQTFPERVTNVKSFPIKKFVTWDEFVQIAKVENKKGSAICVAINQFSEQGRKKEFAFGVNALFADIDTPYAPRPNIGIDPHFIVESSPGKFHYYWLINDCPLSQFKRAQQHLADQCGGDRKVSDLARVMRVPGLLHQKRESFMTRIYEWNINE